MIIKDKGLSLNIVYFCSTFLIVALVLFYTTVPTLAAKNYSTINDTVYKSADAFGLDELPYGEDTAVVQIRYNGDKYITFYFDRMTVYQNSYDASVNVSDTYQGTFDYYYSVRQGTGYNLNICIMSDSPIYYKTSYDSSDSFNQTVGSPVQVLTYRLPDSSDEQQVPQRVYSSVYEFVGSIYNVTGESITNNNYQVYSNVYMIDYTEVDSSVYGNHSFIVPVPATGHYKPTTTGTMYGYELAYYPTTEYLQNSQMRSILNNQWNMLMSIDDKLDSVLSELYSVNNYLMELLTYTQWTYDHLTLYLPWIEGDLTSIIDILNQIKVGPEFDSSQGIGSNNEFGDAFGGLITNDSTPSIDSEKTLVQRNLGDALMFLKLMFDSITARFGLTYLITFLLGLTFISYVLGRVIKNKMHG